MDARLGGRWGACGLAKICDFASSAAASECTDRALTWDSADSLMFFIFPSSFSPEYAKSASPSVDMFLKTLRIFFFQDYYQALMVGQSQVEEEKKQVRCGHRSTSDLTG
jgi:hypothetical protein